jgi:arylsulfatase A-like enzyme
MFRRVVLSGPAAGAFLFVVLFAADFAGLNLEFMGFSDSKATSVIVARYGRKIVLDQLRILGVLMLVGAVLGALGALIGRAFDRAAARNTSVGRAFFRGGLAALVGHAYLLLRHMVSYPALYSEWLFDRAGWRRRAMVFLTDHVRPGFLDALIAGVMMALLARWLATPYGHASSEKLVARLKAIGRRKLAAVGAVVLVGAGLSGLALRSSRADAHPQRPNVLVIAVDSLRADRVFGADAGRFPAIASLSKAGVRFREDHVTVPRTFPSFVTLLTGRWPHHHGVRHMFPSAETRQSIGPTLPSAFRSAGYRTFAVSDYAGEIFSRTPLGFDVVDAPYFDMKTILEQRALAMHPAALPYATSSLGATIFPAVAALADRSDPALLAAKAKRHLDEATANPFFMVLFFSTAHFPYAAPAPFYKRFADSHYDGPFRYEKPPLATASPVDAPQIRALYDGAVAATDAAIGDVLAHLRARHLDGDTIVVLLADHGEHLYESAERGMGHGDHLRGDAADHVPLVIADPVHRFSSHDVDGIVRDVDVAPTLAGLAGVTTSGDGVDLGPLLRGERDTLDLDAFSETEFWLTTSGAGFMPNERIPYPNVTGATDLAPDDDIYLRPEWEETVVVGKHRAIRTRDWKLIYQPTRAGVVWRLEKAGGGDTDLAASHPDVVAALRERLIKWMTSDGRSELRGGFVVPR